MKIKNETYDLLKKIALMVAPVITFIAALGKIWSLPHAAEITATLAALDALLGAFLDISSRAYWEGKDDDGFAE